MKRSISLEQLIAKAGEMALANEWGERAYKINTVILKRDQNNSAACTRLAKYYRLNDNIEEAKQMYLKALEIDPENRGAINNLNDIESDNKENEEVNNYSSIGDLLKVGQKSMTKGKYRFASKLFLKAYNIEPTLTAAMSLAEAYKKMDKTDLIEKLYKDTLDSAKSDIERLKINEFFAFNGQKRI